ncbi:MAG: aminoacylase, partial [Alphaproteobacteria bacterium]|nr:aminoacylase [Alphaproteobacteria bacterium]
MLHEAQASEIRRFEGQSVAEIAQTRGGDEVNAFLDVAVADNLACEYTYASFNTRPERMRELPNDPSVLL